MDILGQLKKMIALTFRSGSYSITLKGKDSPALSKDITIEIADGDATQEMVTDSSVATFTNKTIDSAGTGNNITLDSDAANTTISNIKDADIKAGAAIDATKLGSGTVDNTELGYLDGVTSSIQTQINTDVQNLADHEAEVTGAHAASAISYNNITSGLTATTTQAAVDEVEGRLDTAESNISTNTTNIGTNATDITNIELKTDHITVTQPVNLDTIESDTALNNTHRTTVTGNPHAVTKTEVGLGNVPDVDATNASNISSGTLADARLSSNVDLLDTNQTITGSKTLELMQFAKGTAINNNASSTLAEPDKTTISLTGVPTVTDIVTITDTSIPAERIVVLRNDTASTFILKTTGNIAIADDVELAPEAALLLQYNGTDWAVVGGAGGGAGGLELVYVDNTDSPVTAEISKHYLTNTTSGAITINLPDASALSASNKKVASIRITDSAETWTDNNVTVVPNSGEKIDGLATDESLILDVSGSWLELSWNEDLAHWSLNLAGAGGGGSGGLATEEYAYGSLPSTLSTNIHYLVDFGGGNSLDAPATMPSVADGGSIKVTPINTGTGCTVTLTRAGSDQFNDPDLGLDTVYVIDVSSAEFTANVNDSTWELSDSFWSAGVELREATASQSGVVGTGTQTFAGDKTFQGTITGEGLILGESIRSLGGAPIIASGATETLFTPPIGARQYLVVAHTSNNGGDNERAIAIIHADGNGTNCVAVDLGSNVHTISISGRNVQITNGNGTFSRTILWTALQLT